MPEDLVAVVGLVLVGLAYGIGVSRIWSVAGGGRLVHVADVRWFAAGLLVVVASVVGPLHAAAEGSMSAHMAQHLALVGVAAPLLALGAPLPALLWALPGPIRERVQPRWPVVHRVLTGPRWPVWLFVALVVHVGALWVWHLPVLYDAATAGPLLHGLEHASFLLTGVVFWWLVVGSRRRDRIIVGLSAVFLNTMAATALGVLLTIAPISWYRVYQGSADALEDQQVAGSIMWGFGGTIAAIVAVAIFATWLDAAGRQASSMTVIQPDPTPGE